MKVRINSDGTACGTELVVDETGEPLDVCLTKIYFELDANGLTRAVLHVEGIALSMVHDGQQRDWDIVHSKIRPYPTSNDAPTSAAHPAEKS